MAITSPMLIYLDTNVYSRPFDDQTNEKFQVEANAFLKILAEVKTGTLNLLSSAILKFEVDEALDEEMHMSATVQTYVDTNAVVREGWENLVKNLGLLKATQFVILLERGKGDSVKEIAEYWGNASIEEIHNRVLEWQTKQQPKA
jgi:hypothetical protein